MSVVCGELGLGRGVRRGREVAFTCPFHDDRHPSLRVNEEKNLCYCDVCAIGGDPIWLLRRVRGSGFREAVVELADGGVTY